MEIVDMGRLPFKIPPVYQIGSFLSSSHFTSNVDWNARVSFYPGLANHPQRFGSGKYLKFTWNHQYDPFSDEYAGYLTQGDTGDLDGDGQKEFIIAQSLYKNTGSTSEPQLDWQGDLIPPSLAQTASGLVRDFDLHKKQSLAKTPESLSNRPNIMCVHPAASVGDLNADGKPDVVITFGICGEAWVFWNHSTPGNVAFEATQLYDGAGWQQMDNALSLADINGDGLLDLVAPAGIYYNTGTAQAPNFDFTTSAPWNVTGGPEWLSDWDLRPHIFLRDANGDGLLDAYVSSLSSTVWQVLFYRNTGTAQAHHLEYQGPVVVEGSPLYSGFRGSNEPYWGSDKPLISTADIDQNNLPDLLLSDAGGDMGTPTIVWGFPGAVASTPGLQLSYQDLYTWPDLPKVNYTCGAFMAYQADALCRPPNMFSAWLDLSGDSLSDVLRIDTWMDAYQLYRTTRTGTWPFSLERWDFKQDTPIRSNPSGNQITGLGVTFADIDHDGTLDLVTGSKDGRLLYHRNTVISGPPTYADPAPLADAAGRIITVGENSWPLALDLDGDGDLDFLVGEDSGKIYKVICQNPGQINGYLLGGALGTLEQDPLDIMHWMGGDIYSPSLSAVDMDRDGLLDVVISNYEGGVWLLRNTTSDAAPVYSVAPLIVSRTAAAYLEILDRRQIRLYFALPTVAGQTNLRWDNVPTAGAPLTGMTTIITP